MTTQSRRASVKNTLDLAATILIAVAAVLVIASQIRPYLLAGPSPSGGIPVPKDAVSIAGAARQGNQLAPVVMLEYADFQCPYCARFAQEELPSLRSKYVDSGALLLVFRHYPLSIHRFARPAAEAAVCAGEQLGFRAVHDLLFASQPELERTLAQISTNTSLDRPSYGRCLTEHSAARVDADIATGTALKVKTTPVFFIGVREGDDHVRISGVIKGARPLGEFEAAIDGALRAASALTPAKKGR